MRRYGQLIVVAIFAISIAGCYYPQGRPDYTASGALAGGGPIPAPFRRSPPRREESKSAQTGDEEDHQVLPGREGAVRRGLPAHEGRSTVLP